jgi:integrase
VVLAGPGADEVRGPRRINAVLAGVRGFLAFAVDQGEAPQVVMRQLYELTDSRSLPAEARGEDGAWRLRMRARHHVQVPKTRVSRGSDEEAVALLRACRSARDRLLVLVLCRAGLRRSEAVGLRREDIHFLPDSSGLGCDFPGSHLHVVRRDNVNGAWAKSRHSRSVPVDRLVVQAHDQYVLERADVPAAAWSDFVFVNLFRSPVGAPMKPGTVNDLFVALRRRAVSNGGWRRMRCVMRSPAMCSTRAGRWMRSRIFSAMPPLVRRRSTPIRRPSGCGRPSTGCPRRVCTLPGRMRCDGHRRCCTARARGRRRR